MKGTESWIAHLAHTQFLWIRKENLKEIYLSGDAYRLSTLENVFFFNQMLPISHLLSRSCSYQWLRSNTPGSPEMWFGEETPSEHLLTRFWFL